MNLCLEIFSALKSGKEVVVDTGASHDMDPKYGFFLSYYHSSSGEYVNLGNGAKDTIAVYSATMVQLGGGGGVI